MNDKLYYNPNPVQLKISFLAPSGFGKSTACKILEDTSNSVNIKLSAPLYDIQEYYYRVLGVVNKDNIQDGELLQFLGGKIQRDYPKYLSNVFFDKLIAFSKDESIKIITNDDCRPHNYPALKQMGFVFVGINGYSRRRHDLKTVDPNNPVEWRETIPVDYCIDNKNELDDFKKNIINFLEGLIEIKK